jgi:acyl-ACP thioesterase
VAVERAAPSQFVAPPAGGRTFSQERRPLLGDCAPSGRLRLDALARMLQDVAYLDVDDAGVAELAVWVVRRSRMAIRRFPRFGEHLTLITFCSGLGKMWAERRTTVAIAATGESLIETVSIWVHLDAASWRPTPFSAEEIRLYGDAAAGRRVTARLRHPGPEPGLEDLPGTPWSFRAIDCDIAGHVNNAVYWQPLEEELLLGSREPEAIDVEIEYRTPAQPGEMIVRSHGPMRWIANPAGDAHASIRIA